VKRIRTALVIAVATAVIVSGYALLRMVPFESVLAQNAGPTYSIPVFTNQATATTFVIPQNIGAGSHYLQYCFNNATTGLQIWAESSPDGLANWSAISPIGGLSTLNPNSNCNLLFAGGYYPAVRIKLGTITGVGATVSAWYSSAFGPISPVFPAYNSSGPTVPTACDSTVTRTLANNSTSILVSGLGHGAIRVCSVVISYDATPTQTGTVSLFSDGDLDNCAAQTNLYHKNFTGSPVPVIWGSGMGAVSTAPLAFDFCGTTAGVGANTQITVSYAKY
jgi:hypothetical protein